MLRSAVLHSVLRLPFRPVTDLYCYTGTHLSVHIRKRKKQTKRQLALACVSHAVLFGGLGFGLTDSTHRGEHMYLFGFRVNSLVAHKLARLAVSFSHGLT